MKELIQFIRARGAERITKGKGWIHAEFARERNAELALEAIQLRFGQAVGASIAYDTIKIFTW